MQLITIVNGYVEALTISGQTHSRGKSTVAQTPHGRKNPTTSTGAYIFRWTLHALEDSRNSMFRSTYKFTVYSISPSDSDFSATETNDKRKGRRTKDVV